MSGIKLRGYGLLFWWALIVTGIPAVQHFLLGWLTASPPSPRAERLAALGDWVLLLSPVAVTLAGIVFTHLVRIRETAMGVRLRVTIWGVLITAGGLAATFVVSARSVFAGAM